MRRALFLIVAFLFPALCWATEPTVPAGVVFFDNQYYGGDNVAATDTGWLTKIQAAGWNTGKACNYSGVYPPTGSYPSSSCETGNPYGFFYTVTSTPGMAGTIPGNGKALAVEGWGNTLGGQTDFYLQYGSEGGAVGQVPADVWFQFWILAETDMSWDMGSSQENKFLYPSKGPYPAGADEHNWLVMFRGNSMLPSCTTSTGGDPYFYSFTSNGTVYGTVDACTDPCGQWDFTKWKTGQVNTDNGVKAGTWALVRLHFNFSEAAITAGRHLSEMYVREYGVSDFTLVSRWQNGLDWAPGAGGGCTLTLTPDVSLGYGHKMVRMPSTFGNVSGVNGDVRFYLKDFAIAAGTDSGGNGESDLPYGYGDAAGGSDTTPDSFSSPDNTSVALSTVIYSTSVQVLGIDNNCNISLSGAGCEYRVNSGSWITSGDNVVLYDNVARRVTSSASYSTASNCVLTMGGVSDTWTVTTLEAVEDPVTPRFRGSSMSGGWR